MGLPVSPISNSLVAAPNNTFQITNIVGTSNGATGAYSATFQVNFNQSKLVSPIHPASTQISLQTTSSGSTQTITACAKSTSSQQKTVALNALATFVPSADLTTAGWDGTCNTVISTAAVYFEFNSACSRYCTNGCVASNCPNPQPGQGFGTGSIAECSNIANAATCSCVP